MKHVRSIVITAGVLALVLGSSPRATMAQEQPVVACVKPGSGILRILNPGEACKAQEIALGFNDLPLLVALQQQVVALQQTVENLQDLVQTLQDRVQALEECTALLCTPE